MSLMSFNFAHLQLISPSLQGSHPSIMDKVKRKQASQSVHHYVFLRGLYDGKCLQWNQGKEMQRRSLIFT